MTTHRIITGDSRNLSGIPDGSVQLIVTSPPYPMVEMWDDLFSAQDPDIGRALVDGDGVRAFGLMHSVLAGVWRECRRVLCDSGFACINIGDATRTVNGNFRLYSNHTEIICSLEGLGFITLPDILWRKQSNSPNKFMGSGMYPAGAYVTYEHEYILVFRKGGKRTFSGREKLLRQKSAYFWEERNIWFSDLWEDIKGVAQLLDRPGAERERSAAFPFEIPYRLVNMYSAERDTVLDPFAGLGTTSLACMAANRNSVCIEKDAGLAEIAVNRLLTSPEALNMIIDSRLERHMAFIGGLPEEKRAACYINKPHGFPVKTRQETEIKIDRVAAIKSLGGAVICEYE